MEGNNTGDSTSPVGRSFGPAEFSALASGAPEVVADVAAACELVQIAGARQLLQRELANDSLYVVVHGGLRTVARDVLGREFVVSGA